MENTRSNDHLLAGTARVDITPSSPVSMGGFGQRAGSLSQGVHDPLFAKVLILQNSSQRLVLVTTDLLCIPDPVYSALIKSLKKLGIAEEGELCLTASHTHAGPDMKDNMIVSRGAESYNAQVVERITIACQKATQRMVPVQLKLTTGKVDFLFNRRQRSRADVDERVLAIQVNAIENGTNLAVVFGVGCHPVALGHDNRMLSADYPGYAQKRIEEKLAVTNAMFFNLTEGNVIPVTRGSWDSLDTRGYLGGSFQDAEMIGTALADEVVAALAKVDYQTQVEIKINHRVIKIQPSQSDISKFTAFKQIVRNQKIIVEYLPEFRKVNIFNLQPVHSLWRDASEQVIARNLGESEMRVLMSAVSNYLVSISKLLIPKYNRPAKISILTIKCNQFHLMSLPGEVLVEVGAEWQQRNQPYESTAFVIGLTNGWVGYLPHKQNFLEPEAQYKYETIMNALEPNATLILLDSAESMIKE